MAQEHAWSQLVSAAQAIKCLPYLAAEHRSLNCCALTSFCMSSAPTCRGRRSRNSISKVWPAVASVPLPEPVLQLYVRRASHARHAMSLSARCRKGCRVGFVVRAACYRAAEHTRGWHWLHVVHARASSAMRCGGTRAATSHIKEVQCSMSTYCVCLFVPRHGIASTLHVGKRELNAVHPFLVPPRRCGWLVPLGARHVLVQVVQVNEHNREPLVARGGGPARGAQHHVLLV